MSFSGSSNDDVDSEPPMDVVYPVGEEVEVPGTQGGLFKTVLVEGTGTKPINNSRVSVHYVGTLEDGTKFDSSRDRGEYFEFTIGKGQVIKGWDKGVATMRVGEKACLRCLSHYGYGAAGSPPSIPPNATLLFEVELFDWTCSEDISAKKDKSLMKQVFVEGVGYQKAEFDSDVTLDLRVYVGNYTPNKDDLQPVRVETNWSFRIGQVELPPFLEETLATMRKQESAAVVVRSDILPPDCDHRDTNRTYLVEIHDLKRVQPWEVKGMGLVEEALQRKDMGNAALKDGKLKLSEKYYRRALEFGESGTASEDTVKEECTKAQIAILGNLAQVLLMNKQYRDAVVYSKKVLDLDGGNTKALYRLAKAQDALKEWDEAAEAVGKLLAREPNNADAQALRAHVIAEKKAFDKSQKDTYKKMFS